MALNGRGCVGEAGVTDSGVRDCMELDKSQNSQMHTEEFMLGFMSK